MKLFILSFAVILCIVFFGHACRAPPEELSGHRDLLERTERYLEESIGDIETMASELGEHLRGVISRALMRKTNSSCVEEEKFWHPKPID